MSEPHARAEHFFCHESGRLVAVLTRSLGVRRLEPVEDVVKAALVTDGVNPQLERRVQQLEKEVRALRSALDELQKKPREQ
jgi:hypothetical protein